MSFKPPDDGPADVSAKITVEGIDEAAAKVAGDKLGKALDAGQKAAEAGAMLKSVTQGGAPDVGAHVTGIAGETLGGAVGGVGGALAGGGLPDVGKLATGAVAGVVGEVVGNAVAGAVEKVAGKVAGQITGVVAGGVAGGAINAALGGLIGGGKAEGLVSGELPVFEEIAVTSFNPGKGVQGAVAKAKGKIGGTVGGILGAAKGRVMGKNLEVKVGSGDQLDVRQFSIHERLSNLFQINLIAVSKNPSIDFDEVVGQSSTFTMNAGQHDRFWSGVCNHFEQVRIEPGGESTYQLSIVPRVWLLTQRKNYRIFSQMSELDIVLKVLKEWDIEPSLRVDQGAYKKRKYRVQYAENDFAFVNRMMEDAGITYSFEQEGEQTKLVLSDAPHANPPRAEELSFLDDTSMVQSVDIEYATNVRIGQRVRPGKYTMRDHDYRRPPSYKLMATASKGLPVEEKLERFQYTPGAFLFGMDQGEDTPVADDKGKTRTDEKQAATLAKKRLDAKRGSARVCTFETNAHDLMPGTVVSMQGHSHAALGEGKTLLIVESTFSGAERGEWSHYCEARGTEIPYYPELVTPKPTVSGIESATVVGPPGEEIHTDEFGRVRVHFHWDRESKMDDSSSCWIHVTQGWAGTGFGMIHIPRVGQEVLVDFLGGDPDRPVIVGKVYTNLQKVPYKLPDNKTQSGWKSNSTGGTGGYNEIMFEDAQGKELVNIQAQKDLNKLVKNNETESTGVNRTISVGQNRSADVGENDSTTVGAQYSVTIGAGPTSITMSNDSIVLTTSGATISLGADMISFSAAFISNESENCTIHGTSQVIIDGDDAVLINCTEQPPPDEIEMPSTEDEFVDEIISLIPGGRAIELGAKLIFGEAAVDGVKSQAASYAKQGANAVKGAFGIGG